MKKVFLCAMFAIAPAFGATWDDLRASCSMFTADYKGCLTDLFTAKPAHLTVKSIAPAWL
jgi:hypothetical protein